MTGHFSRRVMEVQGVSPAMLKHHPGAGNLNDVGDGDEFPANFSGSPSRFSMASGTSYSTLYSSVSSLDDDEFEKDSAETVRQLFNNIDSMLYDDEESHDGPVQLREECSEWSDQYRHLRVLGKQLLPEDDLGYQTVTVATKKLNLAPSSPGSNTSSASKLGIQGRQMGISIPMDTISSQNKPDSLKNEQHEEILLLEGEYEELIAVDYSDTVRESNAQHLHAGGESNISSQKFIAIKENLTSLLGNKIWNEVVSWMRPLFAEYMKHIHSGFPKVLAQTAPSVLQSNAMPKTSIQPNARLATAPPRSTMRDDFKGLLTVTSKTLQLRNEKYNGSLPSQSFEISSMNPTSFLFSDNEPSYSISKKTAALRRVPTAVRLTPLDHSLKSNINEAKNEEWTVGQNSQRPKTTKQSSNRVPSSYWTRHIHLPPIQNSDGHSTTKIRATKSIVEKPKKSSPESLEFSVMHNLRKDSINKRHDFRTTRIVKPDNLWRKTTNSLQLTTDSICNSSSNIKSKLVEHNNDSEVLDDDTRHTVEPFVTWLLSQVQSNACKASKSSDKLDTDEATK